MDMQSTLPLIDRLQIVASLWAQAHDAPIERLAGLIAKDRTFFKTLADRPHGPSVATLEKFARFLAEPANWPEGGVPDEAKAFAHVTGVAPVVCDDPAGADSGAGAAASAGKEGDDSPTAQAA